MLEDTLSDRLIQGCNVGPYRVFLSPDRTSGDYILIKLPKYF